MWFILGDRKRNEHGLPLPEGGGAGAGDEIPPDKELFVRRMYYCGMTDRAEAERVWEERERGRRT